MPSWLEAVGSRSGGFRLFLGHRVNMTKAGVPFFTGALLGALLAIMICRSVHSGAREQPPSPVNSSHAPPDESRERDRQLAELKREVSRLQRLVSVLTATQSADVADARRSTGNLRLTGSAIAREQLRALGKEYARLLARSRSESGDLSAEWQRLLEELARVDDSLVATLGVSGAQALYSPFGTPELLLGFLQQTPPGLTEAEMTAVRSALDRSQSAWIHATEGWSDRSELERNLESLELEILARREVVQFAGFEQLDAIRMLDSRLASGTSDKVYFPGDRDTFASRVAADWGEKLRADAGQRRDLERIAREFRDDYELHERELLRGIPPGGSPDWRAKQCAELRTMVTAIGRMSDSMTLTDEQKAKLKAWSEIYSWRER